MSSFTPINVPSSSSAMPTTLNLADHVNITLFCKHRSQDCNHNCKPGTSAAHHGHVDLLQNPVLLDHLSRQTHTLLTASNAEDFQALYTRLGHYPETIGPDMEIHRMLREEFYVDGDMGNCYLVKLWIDCIYCKKIYQHKLIVRADGVGTSQSNVLHSVVPKPTKKRKLDEQRSEDSNTDAQDGKEGLEETFEESNQEELPRKKQKSKTAI
ncbi:MAG: hypothetical protein M1812_004535 [Candelaria pacifica]|nr:MAG: hypothetical protein M1812_004535 [Candelaria pacifica]